MDSKIREFIDYLEKEERSSNTIKSYIQSLQLFFSRYSEVSKENMIEFKESQLDHNKPRTARLRCIALNQYCDFIGKPECKTKKIKIHGEKSVENVPTMEEYRYFLDCLKSDGKLKMYWMLRFIAATGVRVSELVSLDKACLRTGRFEMMTKGKVRTILIPSRLILESSPYFDTVEGDLLFPNRYGDKYGTRGVTFMISKYGRKYGVRPEILHPHAFRHFFAIHFLESSGNLVLLSNLLGHENINTTAIYLQLSEAEQTRKLDACVSW